MIQTILFDMDGLLFDTEKLYARAMKQAFVDQGVHFSLDDYRMFLGMSDADTLQVIEENYGSRSLAESVMHDFVENFERFIATGELEMKKGAKSLLEALDQKEMMAYIVSSSTAERIEQHLQDHGIRHFFKGVMSGDEVEHSKPAPDIYQKALADFNLNPSQVMVLEDSLNGVRSAIDAGLKVVMVPDLVQPSEELEAELYGQAKDLFEVKAKWVN
ncbi:beta-phosphoglucomutase [Suicoccus acidiformans]|uniref:Beta-phosphoglucomutase n=1 Tax=Suicoccus acidiformans TaxID=2036206 RepID=A0A347WL23_9LACT|nr:HAD family phosphatase [Suicoccus acidiformans]AXY25780.1 beta-phosphoglucomutase [Suicoccus acidiformans]